MTSVKPTPNILIVLVLLLILWIGTYAALFRRGYAESDRWNSEGFHYFAPENTNAWRRSEAICTYAFWPLNLVDRSLGTGRGHSSEPLWDLN